MEGIQPLLTAQESGRTRRMHEMIEFPSKTVDAQLVITSLQL